MPITMAPDAPMTEARAKREIERVLAQLEGTGVIVTDIGMMHYDVTAMDDPNPVHRREIYITLQQPSPRFTPFAS